MAQCQSDGVQPLPRPRYVREILEAIGDACSNEAQSARTCVVRCAHTSLAEGRACGVAVCGWLLGYGVSYVTAPDATDFTVDAIQDEHTSRSVWHEPSDWSIAKNNLGDTPLLQLQCRIRSQAQGDALSGNGLSFTYVDALSEMNLTC